MSFLKSMGFTDDERSRLRAHQDAALQPREATPAECAKQYKADGWSSSFKQNQIYRPIGNGRIQIADVPAEVWELM